MTAPNVRLRRAREAAYKSQSGRCFYCRLPMLRWGCPQARKIKENFCDRHGLTYAQAKRLRLSAEHLVRRQDGGGHSRENIVAACVYCNQSRHRAGADPTPKEFKSHVREQMMVDEWHRFKCTHMLSIHQRMVFTFNRLIRGLRNELQT